MLRLTSINYEWRNGYRLPTIAKTRMILEENSENFWKNEPNKGPTK